MDKTALTGVIVCLPLMILSVLATQYPLINDELARNLVAASIPLWFIISSISSLFLINNALMARLRKKPLQVVLTPNCLTLHETATNQSVQVLAESEYPFSTQSRLVADGAPLATLFHKAFVQLRDERDWIMRPVMVIHDPGLTEVERTAVTDAAKEVAVEVHWTRESLPRPRPLYEARLA